MDDYGFIAFTLNKNTIVEGGVFNLLGQKVLELARHDYPAGPQIISFPAGNLAPGLYFILVRMGNRVVTGKMLRN
jgi:hypothetical protein